MYISRNRPVRQLKIMAQTYQMRPAAGVLQKSVIKSFSVADPVATQVKDDPRDNDQISFIRLMVNPRRTWFQNAEGPFLQRLNPFDLAKHHMMPADRRIQHPFPRLKCRGQNQACICFVMGGRIQRNALSSDILIEREQIELCFAAGCMPRIMTERTTLCQQLRTKRAFGHTGSFISDERSGPEVVSGGSTREAERGKRLEYGQAIVLITITLLGSGFSFQ